MGVDSGFMYTRRRKPYRHFTVKKLPVRTVNGLRALLVSAILCGMVQTAAGQSSAKDKVLAALAERDKVFLAGDEAKVAQSMTED